jgi:copper chaperone
MTSNATFQVTGMTCDHCAGAVIEELGRVDGVSSVRVQLVPAGESVVLVASDRPLDPEAVAAALDEAGGYHLAGT